LYKLHTTVCRLYVANYLFSFSNLIPGATRLNHRAKRAPRERDRPTRRSWHAARTASCTRAIFGNDANGDGQGAPGPLACRIIRVRAAFWTLQRRSATRWHSCGDFQVTSAVRSQADSNGVANAEPRRHSRMKLGAVRRTRRSACQTCKIAHRDGSGVGDSRFSCAGPRSHHCRRGRFCG